MTNNREHICKYYFETVNNHWFGGTKYGHRFESHEMSDEAPREPIMPPLGIVELHANLLKVPSDEKGQTSMAQQEDQPDGE